MQRIRSGWRHRHKTGMREQVAVPTKGARSNSPSLRQCNRHLMKIREIDADLRLPVQCPDLKSNKKIEHTKAQGRISFSRAPASHRYDSIQAFESRSSKRDHFHSWPDYANKRWRSASGRAKEDLVRSVWRVPAIARRFLLSGPRNAPVSK